MLPSATVTANICCGLGNLGGLFEVCLFGSEDLLTRVTMFKIWYIVLNLIQDILGAPD